MTHLTPALLLLTGCHVAAPPLAPERLAAEAAGVSVLLCKAPVAWRWSEATRLAGYDPAAHEIVLSRSALRVVARRYGDAAVVGIVAHELGHACDHAAGRDLAELPADTYAGCLLGLLGERTGPLERFLAAESGDDYPTVDERTAAVRRGWASCERLW
jgi:hypothetical protein